jgi:hypothetical protein
MAQTNLLTYIYGTVLGITLFLFIRYLYSVYYTPGVRTLYNSPVTQQLFPNAMNKIYPLWGYNKAGMYDDQPFKFGADRFYPESGPGYKPTKYGSGGGQSRGRHAQDTTDSERSRSRLVVKIARTSATGAGPRVWRGDHSYT